MGRKERRDIDYFPFFIKDGRTLFILEDKYQCKGTGFFTNLFRFLSRTPDHHFQLKEESDRLYFFASTKCDPESAIDMIELMVTTGKLDKDLWDQKSVLASEDFLESIQEAYRKRSNTCITLQEIKQKYNITSGRNTQASANLPEEITLNTQAGVVSGVKNPQTKLKQTKLKQTTGEMPEPDSKPSPKKALVLNKLKETMSMFIDQRYQHNIQLFVQANWNKNDDAIIHCLNQLMNSKDPIRYPKTWMEKILSVENGNFNAEESLKEHEEHKKPIPIEGIPGLGNVLKSMGNVI